LNTTEKDIREGSHPFLRGGGEMGELTRNFDWSKTSIGTPDNWPYYLRTTVSNLLRSKFPMFLWWGEEMIQFYNDAYRPSLGIEGKHPGALGQKGRECWPEIWNIISPLLQQVRRSGEATWMEDQLVPIHRNGRLEDVYWTYSYSSVLDDKGEHAGILVTCTETTEKVLWQKQLGIDIRERIKAEETVKESETRFRNLADESPMFVFIIDADPLAPVSYWNKTWLNYTGQTFNEALGRAWNGIIHEDDIPIVLHHYMPALEKREPYFMPAVRVKRHDGEYRWHAFKGNPRYSATGKFEGFVGVGFDVHEQWLAEQALRISEEELEQKWKNAQRNWRDKRISSTISSSIHQTASR
jgi:PAS domain S-box-containing protein